MSRVNIIQDCYCRWNKKDRSWTVWTCDILEVKNNGRGVVVTTFCEECGENLKKITTFENIDYFLDLINLYNHQVQFVYSKYPEGEDLFEDHFHDELVSA